MEGGSLRTALPVFRGDQTRCHRVLTQIAEALVYLHANRLAHLDVKPENVLFSDHSLQTAKLCDFGLASTTAPASGLSAVASAFVGAGTSGYVAPEVRHQEAALQVGGQPVATTQRADIFGFGVMGIELYTKHDANMVSELAKTARPMLLHHLKETGVSTAMSELLMRCVSIDAGPRPTAAELYRLLQGMVLVQS
jgi:serine/threonine protein kinase